MTMVAKWDPKTTIYKKLKITIETKRHKKEEKEEKDVVWSSCMTN